MRFYPPAGAQRDGAGGSPGSTPAMSPRGSVTTGIPKRWGRYNKWQMRPPQQSPPEGTASEPSVQAQATEAPAIELTAIRRVLYLGK